MSPARQYLAQLAAAQAAASPESTPIGPGQGGQPAPVAPAISPAATHVVATAVATGAGQGAAAPDRPATDTAAAQILLRLRHDLRRLKDIQSIERKVEAKREMLPNYRPWCDTLLALGRAAADRTLGPTGADDVLPTIMVWCIDTGDWARAVELAHFVLDFSIPLPARYERAAASLIVEEIAEAALKSQARGEAFPLAVLMQVEAMTADTDMHDEIRAKIMKAIGVELDRNAADAGTPTAQARLRTRALETLRRAQDLHGRVGVRDRIKRLEKAVLAADTAAGAQAEKNTAGATAG